MERLLKHFDICKQVLQFSVDFVRISSKANKTAYIEFSVDFIRISSKANETLYIGQLHYMLLVFFTDCRNSLLIHLIS